MNPIEAQIQKLVSDFAAQVAAVARRAAVSTLTSALDGDVGARRGSRRSTGALSTGSRRAKGEKRPAAEIAGMSERVRKFVAENPGLRVEQINKALGTSTKELALPLRKLVAAGAVRSEGVKRSTQYFQGDGAKATGATPSKRRKKK